MHAFQLRHNAFMRDVKANSKRLLALDAQLSELSFQQRQQTMQQSAPADVSMDSHDTQSPALSDLDQLRLDRSQLVQRTLQLIQSNQAESFKMPRIIDDDMEDDVTELGLALKVQITQESLCEGLLEWLMQLS